MLADRPVQPGEFRLVAQLKVKDDGTQAAHQVRQQRAARVTGRVRRGVHGDVDVFQPRLPVQLCQPTADAQVGLQIMGFGHATSYYAPGGLNVRLIAPPHAPPK